MNSSRSGGQYPAVEAGDPSGLTDDVLIRASLDEPQAFGQIYDRHARLVHRYLTSRVGSSAADDLVSEVFISAFRGRKGYDAKYASAIPWLLGIAANVARHHHRSENRRSALLRRLGQHAREGPNRGLGDLGNEIVIHSQFEGIGEAIAQLDERCRDVLILFAAFDMSYAQIAEALGLRIGTVRSRISRGRLRLRELLIESGQYDIDERPKSRSSEVEGSAR